MDDRTIKNIKELNDQRGKNEILSDCIKELKVDSNSWWQLAISVTVALAVSIYIAFFTDTVTVVRGIIPLFLDVELAMFAVVFGAYAIFQALMRDEIIKELIRTENNILRDSNRTFLNLSILYILDIFATVVFSICVNICPIDFYVYSIIFSNITFTIIFLIFSAMNFMLILENLNFAINMYRMFNVYNIYRALDVIENEEK